MTAGAGWARNLIAYNGWANNLVLNAAAGLDEEQFKRNAGGSWGSVRGHLVHILSAEVWWHSVLTAAEHRPDYDQWHNASSEQMRGSLGESRERFQAYAAGLTDESLAATVKGKEKDWPAWQPLLHVILHGTQHRGEIGVLLSSMGNSPGDLDYGHFCDISGSDSPGTLQIMRTLYDFTEWANGRVLEKIKGMTDDELRESRGVSHNSIGMDLLHLLGAQVGWLSIWQKHAPMIALPSGDGATFAQNLRDWFGLSHAAIREFIATLSDGTLGETRTDNEDGHNPHVEQHRSMLLWDMMAHVVNHGAQHRGEVGAALAAIDRSPGDLDFLDYTDTIAVA